MHRAFTFDYVDCFFIGVMMHWSAAGRNHSYKLSNSARADLLIHQQLERAVPRGSRLDIALAHGAKRLSVLWGAHNRVNPNLRLFVLRATNADYLDITDAASPVVYVLDLIDAARRNIDGSARL